jgi:hypothetical protein
MKPFPFLFLLEIASISAFLTPDCPAFDLRGIRVGDTPASRIAKQRDIVGKGQHGQCLAFAVELNQRLRAAGIKSQVIGYHYQDLSPGGRNGGAILGHAVVVYEDRGRTYVMDNQSWAPRWINPAPVGTMLGQFGGLQAQVQRAFVVDSSAKAPPHDRRGASPGQRGT